MLDALFPSANERRTPVSPRHLRGLQLERNPGRQIQEQLGPSGSRRFGIEQALRAWRLSEAKHRKIPAFRVFGDRALLGIATTCPQNDAELLAVPGIGMSIVKKYGAHIYRLVAGSS